MINIAKIEEYYLFHIVVRKIPDILGFVEEQNVDKERWDLIATINSQFFQEIFSHFQICYLRITEWPRFIAQILLNSILMFQIVSLFFISVLVKVFFNMLPDFSANISFTLSHCKQLVLSFQTL